MAQHDSRPAGGAFPTQLWTPGDLVADTLDLPLARPLPPGAEIRTGLYDPAGGAGQPHDMAGTSEATDFGLPLTNP